MLEHLERYKPHALTFEQVPAFFKLRPEASNRTYGEEFIAQVHAITSRDGEQLYFCEHVLLQAVCWISGLDRARSMVRNNAWGGLGWPRPHVIQTKAVFC